MKLFKSAILPALILAVFNLSALAQQTGSIAGQVVDSLGAVVVGATVTAVSADGKERSATTDQRGQYAIPGLAAGAYTIRVTASNFAPFENPGVEVVAGKREDFTASLTVAGVAENVEVGGDQNVSTDPENNAGATVLKEKDLEALPDDPEDLEAALQALAGPSAGPNGGQIYIDGFTGGRLPPKDAIREIRINQNPFSAEYERLGFGRIEILTKPGSDKWRGSAFFNFNDESLNSRNPFALNRAPSQTRFFGGNISGPIQKGKSSFFLDISNRDIDNNSVVNALILDPNLNPVPFQQEFQIPSRRFSISPRFDYQINDKNTLVARYSFSRSSVENSGIGDISLPSIASNTESIEHEFRLTETMIVNPKTVNETRFQYEFDDRRRIGDNSIPTISVASAFVGGGSQIGDSFTRSNSWELSNYTTTTFGKSGLHAVKFGARLRGISLTDRSESNFGGTFSFGGFSELRNPPGCSLDTPGCTTVAPAVSPLEQYQRLLSGEIDTVYNNFIPTQFSISAGNPAQKISQTDVGLFITDDWRYSPALTLSFGLRYENQTNIKDNKNFAPRASFAWSPGAGGAKAPKTVFRGGAGLFFDRFSESLSLTALRFNGLNQFNYVVNVNDPDPVRRAAAIALLSQPVFTLDGVSNAPTAGQIAALFPSSNVIRTISPELQSPTTFQVALGVERQIPWRTTISAFYIGSRSWHVLRSRNINAPICPEQENCFNAPRPDPTQGNLYQYESSGTSNQNQLIFNFRSNPSPMFSLFGNYRYGFAKSDADGVGSFPAYTYDLSDEYGRSSFDIRHNFVFGGNFNLPWQISLSPFVIANSGRPFNIIRGIDTNGDALFTERPTFAELGEACIARGLTTTWCDVSGNDPNAVIPRNWGQAPKFFSVNLRISKNIGFGKAAGGAAVAGSQQGPDAGGGGGRRGGGGGGRGGRGGAGAVVMGTRGGGFGGFGGGDVRKPYNLNIGIQFTNLFNNVNFGSPVGNLASSRFGQSTSTIAFGGFGGGGGGTANRKVELQMRFSW